jgi:hypothetical protein
MSTALSESPFLYARRGGVPTQIALMEVGGTDPLERTAHKLSAHRRVGR